MAWNHVFWNMGKMEFPPETSVVSHTIAFQAILVNCFAAPSPEAFAAFWALSKSFSSGFRKQR